MGIEPNTPLLYNGCFMDYSYDHNLIQEIAVWLQTGSINIFGRPFAGKDTQGRILADLFDGVLLGGGEILRNSVIPERSRAAIQNGELIPTEDYIDIVLPYLSKEEFAGKPLILSSVGRWHGEEEGVIGATFTSKHEMKAVIYLDLSEEDSWERWRKDQEEKSKGDRGNRSDDVEEVLKRRFKEFDSKTLPVLDYYRDTTDMFITVQANQHGATVTANILEALKGLADKSTTSQKGAA
jgi:adenylate kinase